MTSLWKERSPAAPRPRRWLEFARRGAVVAGFFSAVIGLVLLAGHLAFPTDDPLKSIALKALKDKLHENPADEALKQQIRAFDLQSRQAYFRHLNLNRAGAWLLIGGAALFLLSTRKVSAAAEKLPAPKLVPDGAEREARMTALARWAVAGSGSVVVVSMLALAAAHRPPLPDDMQALEKLLAGGGAPTRPEVTAFVAGQWTNWPRFRGPLGTGVAFTTNAPLTWNATNGEGVVWQVPVPAKGHSSPIVWGNHVFLTGGDAKARVVMCFDSNTGTLLWQKTAPPPPGGFAKETEVPEDTGFAASTPATDGTRIFASFATGELVAFDFSGNVVWSKHLGVPENPYGHGTSLLVWQDRLIVQFDQGEAEMGKSRIYAFDTSTGRELWQQRRALSSSWGTPIVIEQGSRKQLIAVGDPLLIAYDVSSGAEMWRADCMGSDLAPSPVFAGGMVIVASPNKQLTAIRPDGQGDVTTTHIVWKLEDFVPDITSPVATDELLFTVTTSGLLGCVDVKSGKKVWDYDLRQDFNASPTLVGDRLYLFGLKGESIVLAAGREAKELARGRVGEPVHASPAFVGGRVFVRGAKNLFCLGEKK